MRNCLWQLVIQTLTTAIGIIMHREECISYNILLVDLK